MKSPKHSCQNYLIINAAIVASLCLASLVQFVGCGNGNPTDAELDRVPNVPASSRASDGAMANEPTKKK